MSNLCAFPVSECGEMDFHKSWILQVLCCALSNNAEAILHNAICCREDLIRFFG